MDDLLNQWMAHLPLLALFAIIGVMIYTLGKGADWLVTEAVTLSVAWKIPTVVIGATIVSLGTTLPEASVSVLAALQGDPELALGNAVGSIICDTGLILGIAACMAPLPLPREVVNRQGWIQLGAGILLVVICFPWHAPATALTDGGRLPRAAGFVFLAILIAYVVWSIRWSRQSTDEDLHAEGFAPAEHGTPLILFRLIAGIVLVIGSSKVLIPAASQTALRLGVPESVIAATMVAFGTSLPELVSAITAVRRGHGERAVGNVVGADILNVLFVSGAAAAALPGGLQAPPHFFRLLFPAMLGILVIFRVGVFVSRDTLRRRIGITLLVLYALVTVSIYLIH